MSAAPASGNGGDGDGEGESDPILTRRKEPCCSVRKTKEK